MIRTPHRVSSPPGVIALDLQEGVAGDELKLGVGEAAVPRQPSDGLMPERVRRGLHAGLLRVTADDLLDAARRVLAVPPRLEQVAVAAVGRDVRPPSSALRFGSISDRRLSKPSAVTNPPATNSQSAVSTSDFNLLVPRTISVKKDAPRWRR